MTVTVENIMIVAVTGIMIAAVTAEIKGKSASAASAQTRQEQSM
jgi:hypothetical protein